MSVGLHSVGGRTHIKEMFKIFTFCKYLHNFWTFLNRTFMNSNGGEDHRQVHCGCLLTSRAVKQHIYLQGACMEESWITWYVMEKCLIKA